MCNGADNESPSHIHPTGSFSINDSNGSENVTFKMNECFFKLCCVYSNSRKMSNNVGKFS